MTETFVQNTILTKYGLNRLNQPIYANANIYIGEELVPNEFVAPDFNFTKILIGNLTGALDIETTHLENSVYELQINSVKQNNSIFTFKCVIDKDIEGLNINQIGLIETINNIDYLFAYGNVDINKSTTSYELTLNIDFNIETLQLYKDSINVKVNPPKVISLADWEEVKEKTWDIYRCLQHPINSNLIQLIQQPINEAFSKEKYLSTLYECYDYVSEYICIRNINEPTNTFMFPTIDYLSYSVNNLAKDNSKLLVNNNIFTSENDSCTFTNKNTLIITGKFTDHNGIILNKIDSNFNFNFKIEVLDGSLIIQLGEENHSLHYIVPINSWGVVNSEECIHTITYDNSTIKYYMNGYKIEGELININFYNPIYNDDMVLSNNISNTSVFDSGKKIRKIVFFDTCLTDIQVQNVNKIITYNFL